MEQYNYNFDQICARNNGELIHYKNNLIFYSDNNGDSWEELPWKLSVFGKLLVWRSGWPPFIDCFGWRNGAITIAWHDVTEEEIRIGKYCASYDMNTKKWKPKVMGTFDLAESVEFTWFEDVGFEVFSRIRQLTPPALL